MRRLESLSGVIYGDRRSNRVFIRLKVAESD